MKACHASLAVGDTLMVPALDRYDRSFKDLVNMVGELRRRGIGFCSLHERPDTNTPARGGRLVFHVSGALAEFIRELIVAGAREGLNAALGRGRVGGRPTVVTPEIIWAASAETLPLPLGQVECRAALMPPSRACIPRLQGRPMTRPIGPVDVIGPPPSYPWVWPPPAFPMTRPSERARSSYAGPVGPPFRARPRATRPTTGRRS
ncbi:recombinase family protein [Streptomyces acidicola]|uniref:recombinase family protein n=1 Tax=Streptomyces acidicola TaxID=2596892 RepID=UPI00382282D0